MLRFIFIFSNAAPFVCASLPTCHFSSRVLQLRVLLTLAPSRPVHPGVPPPAPGFSWTSLAVGHWKWLPGSRRGGQARVASEGAVIFPGRCVWTISADSLHLLFLFPRMYKCFFFQRGRMLLFSQHFFFGLTLYYYCQHNYHDLIFSLSSFSTVSVEHSTYY